jgi:predicted N-acetyltransferase YhbS
VNAARPPAVITVRRAAAADVDRLTEIERDADQRYLGSAHPQLADGGTIPRDALAGAVDRGTVMVAELDGEVVGWALFSRVGKELCLGQISVLRAAGGRGVGARLMEVAISSARAMGEATLVLNTQRDVPWNAPWYERFGFEVVDEADWTRGMRSTAEEQEADGLDWSSRVHMRLTLADP